MGLIEFFKNALRKIWNFLKELGRIIMVVILRFTDHIISWAKKTFSNISDYLKRKLKQDKAKLVAVKIEENLEQGNFNEVNAGILMTIYDEEKHEIVEEQSEFIEYEKLDEETQAAFRNKNMLVLR